MELTIEQVKNKANNLYISVEYGQGNELREAKVKLHELQNYTFEVLKPTQEDFFKIFGFAIYKYYDTSI